MIKSYYTNEEMSDVMKSKISWVQICWLVVSILLFCAGVFAHTRHEMSLVELSEPLGMAMLTAGAINIAVCLIKSHAIHGSRWLVADGVTAFLLSLFPLFNDMIVINMIPLFFGMWELFSGLLKFMDSMELKEERVHCWHMFAFIGAVELISGTLSLIKPIDDFVGINEVIAIIFFIQAVGFGLKTLMYRYLTIS